MPDMRDMLQRDLTQDLGDITLKAMQAVEALEEQELLAEQESSQLAFLESVKESVNPYTSRLQQRQKKIEDRFRKATEAELAKEKAVGYTPIERLKKAADDFEKKNPELKAKALVDLRGAISDQDTAEEILDKILKYFPDVSLADEALNFLLEQTDHALQEKVLEAKDHLSKRFKREIEAGRNILRQAQEAARGGVGSPTSLRDLYRDITGNPRDSNTLFQELSEKYAFKDLKKILDFLFHSLGDDLKSKGPSISPGLLHRLITEIRSLQAILGVYRFFRTRMKLIQKLFAKQGIPTPPQLSFELLSRQFMVLCNDRYPTGDKVLQMSSRLGIEKWIIAKIIVFSQLRDAVREMATQQIYNSFQHRDEVFNAIIEALESLEDELEDLADQL